MQHASALVKWLLQAEELFHSDSNRENNPPLCTRILHWSKIYTSSICRRGKNVQGQQKKLIQLGLSSWLIQICGHFKFKPEIKVGKMLDINSKRLLKDPYSPAIQEEKEKKNLPNLSEQYVLICDKHVLSHNLHPYFSLTFLSFLWCLSAISNYSTLLLQLVCVRVKYKNSSGYCIIHRCQCSSRQRQLRKISPQKKLGVIISITTISINTFQN